MAFNNNVSWFVSFHAHDPSRNKKCICYAPSKGRRCLAPCERPDNQRAIELHRQIINDLSAEAVDIQLLEEYILCVCCRFGYHRDNIQDAGDLTPLAERWLDEIKRHAAEQSRRTVSTAPLGANIFRPGAATTPTTPTPGRVVQAYAAPTATGAPGAYFNTPGHTRPVALPNTTPITYATPTAYTAPTAYTTPKGYATAPVYTSPAADTNSLINPSTPARYSTSTTYTTPTASPLSYRLSTPTSNNANTPSPAPATNASNNQGSPSKSSTISPQTVPTPSESQPHYDLRPRNASVRSETSPQPPLSEFRTHIAEPDPTHSVSSKIQDYLYGRDFETGSLYIFDRKSSPEHVKIGWTARTVTGRLESLSKCGYTPNLLFRVDYAPHAQRVETLTHYELMKEWRRERRCNKGLGCQIAHREWFEISKERAKQVLGGWAKFMTVAEPYDPNGYLKMKWMDFVQETAKSGEPVTVAKLLEHYELSLAEDTTLMAESAESEPEPKIEKQEEGVPSAPKPESTNDHKKAEAQLDSRPTELPTPAKVSQLLKSKASPTPVPLTPPPSEQKERPKIDPIGFGPLSKSPFSFETGSSYAHSLPKFEDLFKFDSPAKTRLSAPAQSSPKAISEGLFKTETLPKSEFTFTTESPHKMKPPSTTTDAMPKTPFKFNLPKTGEYLEPENSLKTPFSFASKSLFKFEPVLKTGARPGARFTFTSSTAIPIPDSLFGTTLPSKTKPPQEDIAAEKVLPNKQSSPEQTQLSPPSPIPPPLRSADTEGNKEKESVSEHRDGPVHESVIKAEDADESEATEAEAAAGNDDWDNEDTLVEIVAPGSLKEEAFKIAKGLCPETSIAKAKGLEVLKSKVPPAAQVVAQA